ncbi:hypothetical protein BTR22_05285 [Alkalihalophilus pseudofirmus]|uniref:hypothetical protein n=1 Tax=Alkalihalophilus pseudofirmus TaxID=79885 RepID=UPI000951C552|nr:hypothetical protein BTR22_05285 [Alkalihalophilus pseudofirmus]
MLQRGIGNVNQMKMARCIVELERIYGIRNGSANSKGLSIGEGNNSSHDKTQKDLATEIGLDVKQLRNLKKLNTLIPELQDMVEDGEDLWDKAWWR